MRFTTFNLCDHCLKTFQSERSTKKYCSDSCKQLAYLNRRAKKLAAATYIEDDANEKIPELIEEVPAVETKLHEDTVEAEVIIEQEHEDTVEAKVIIKQEIPRLPVRHRRARPLINPQPTKPAYDGRLLVCLGICAAGMLLNNMEKSLNKKELRAKDGNTTVNASNSFNRHQNATQGHEQVIKNAEKSEHTSNPTPNFTKLPPLNLVKLTNNDAQ